jgi:chemotaxis response regulator CheB
LRRSGLAIKIVMASTLTESNAVISLTALSAAADYVAKPTLDSYRQFDREIDHRKNICTTRRH